MDQHTRPGVSEIVTFVAAALCAVLGLLVSPRYGGATWLVLAVAALLLWQGVTLRRRRTGSTSES
ncbi:hypothetical protein M3148_11620 [Georgenia satyanarayanai]|uniref:hypothetical protein n=1 Tax=Georgenia satyanarayanai TaxID=860221 RepID=UPI00203E6490|nr:hypothetical protein [Georgenia satyanarayanai]MCM3661633.1 hypothetical protein [Georgenia satyanarayanai]